MEQIIKQVFIWLTYVPSTAGALSTNTSATVKSIATNTKKSGKNRTSQVAAAVADELIEDNTTSVSEGNDANVTSSVAIQICHDILLQYSQHEPIIFDKVLQSVQSQLSQDVLYQDAVTQGIRVSFTDVMKHLFVTVPYRQPVVSTSTSSTKDTELGNKEDLGGLSLYLSLTSTSVQTRLAAIRRYNDTVSLSNTSTTNTTSSSTEAADLQGLAEAVARQLCETNVDIVQAVWQPAIIRKVMTYIPFSLFYEMLYESINYWLELVLQGQSLNTSSNSSSHSNMAVTVLHDILKCVSEKSVLQLFLSTSATTNDIADNKINKLKLKARDWLLSVILYVSSLSLPKLTSSIVTADDVAVNDNNKKLTTKKSKKTTTIMSATTDSVKVTNSNLLDIFLKNYIALVYPTHSSAYDISTSNTNSDLAKFLASTLLPGSSHSSQHDANASAGVESSETLRLLQSFSSMVHHTVLINTASVESLRLLPVIIKLYDEIFDVLFQYKASIESSSSSTADSVELKKVDTTIHLLLTIYFPMLLRLLNSPAVMFSHIKSSELPSLVIASVSSFFKLYIAHPSPYHKSSNATHTIRFMNIFNSTLSPIYSNDLSMRVLIGLLSVGVGVYDSEKIQLLISQCLEAFFNIDKSQLPLALLQILTVTTPATLNTSSSKSGKGHHHQQQQQSSPSQAATGTIEVSVDDYQPFISRELISMSNHTDSYNHLTSSSASISSSNHHMSTLTVPITGRLGALKCLILWIDSFTISLSNNNANNNNNILLSLSSFRNVLLILPVICFTCCTDENSVIRKVALQLASSLKKLWSTSHAHLVKQSSGEPGAAKGEENLILPQIPGMTEKIIELQHLYSTVPSNNTSGLPVHSETIIQLLNHILQGDELIVSDALAAQSYFASTLFITTSTATTASSNSNASHQKNKVETMLNIQLYLLHSATYFASTHDLTQTTELLHTHTHIHNQHTHIPTNNYYISSSVFKCLAVSTATLSFSYLWPYVYTILSDTSANIIDGFMHSTHPTTLTFYSLLIQLLSKLDVTKLQVAGDKNKYLILESVCEYIIETFSLPSHVHTHTVELTQSQSPTLVSLLSVIQDELMSILTPLWINNFPLTIKYNLYEELFSIYYNHLSHKLSSSISMITTTTTTTSHPSHNHLHSHLLLLPYHKVLQHFRELSFIQIDEVLIKYSTELIQHKLKVQTSYETQLHKIEVKFHQQHKQRSDSISSQNAMNIDDAWEVDDEWMAQEEAEREKLQQAYVHAIVQLCQLTGQITEILLATYKNTSTTSSNTTGWIHAMRSLLRRSIQLLSLFDNPMYSSNSNIDVNNNNTTNQTTDKNNTYQTAMLTAETSYALDYTRSLLCQLANYAFEYVASTAENDAEVDSSTVALSHKLRDNLLDIDVMINNNTLSLTTSNITNLNKNMVAPKVSKKKTKGDQLVNSATAISTGDSNNNNTTVQQFTKEEIEQNVTTILSVLHLSETVQAQSSVLLLLRQYILHYSACMHTIISSLGSLVAQSAVLVTGEDNKGKLILIQDILRTCITSATTATSVMSNDNDGSMNKEKSHLYTIYQHVLQSLFKYCPDMAPSTRAVLVTLVAETYGPSAIPALITVLLAHVYSAYAPMDSSNNLPTKASKLKNANILNSTNKNNTSSTSAATVSNDDVTILLSAASQRKARKMLLSSLPEEIYKLIIHLTEQLPAVFQTYTIVTLIKQTHYLIHYSTKDYLLSIQDNNNNNNNNNSHQDQEQVSDISIVNLFDIDRTSSDTNENDENNSDIDIDTEELPVSAESLINRHRKDTDIRGIMSVSGQDIIQYTVSLQQTSSTSSETEAVEIQKSKSVTASATLALLHLQYLADIFEHKLKQIQINNNNKNQKMKSHDNNNEQQAAFLQSSYLTLVDQMLQLYAFTSSLQHVYNVNRHNNNTKDQSQIVVSNLSTVINIPVDFDKTTNSVIYRRFPCGALGHLFSQTSLDILKTIQYFLDISTFITIFQELMIHTDPAVRNKAFEMLHIRLEEIYMKLNLKDTLHENILFMDLFNQLRSYLTSLLLTPTSVQALHNHMNDNEHLFIAIEDDEIANTLTAHQRLMLTQSVLQSLDVLVKHFYKIIIKLKTSHETMRKEWEKIFLNSLIESITICQLLSGSLLHTTSTATDNNSSSMLKYLKLDGAIMKYYKKSNLHEGYSEVIKGLGAFYLYTATLCTALKNKVLPHLSVSLYLLITTLLYIFVFI